MGRSIPFIAPSWELRLQILQSPDYVVLNDEFGELRLTPLGGSASLPPFRQWTGFSRGRWEGDTLVIETAGFNDKWSFHGSGPRMRLVERFTRTDDDRLDYEFTVHDPESFASPWTATFPFTSDPGPLYEVACPRGQLQPAADPQRRSGAGPRRTAPMTGCCKGVAVRVSVCPEDPLGGTRAVTPGLHTRRGKRQRAKPRPSPPGSRVLPSARRPAREVGRADDPERSRDGTLPPAAETPAGPARLCSGRHASAEVRPPTVNGPPGRGPAHCVRPPERPVAQTTSCSRFAWSLGEPSRRERSIGVQGCQAVLARLESRHLCRLPGQTGQRQPPRKLVALSLALVVLRRMSPGIKRTPDAAEGDVVTARIGTEITLKCSCTLIGCHAPQVEQHLARRLCRRLRLSEPTPSSAGI